jgi:hypothetical protein
MSSNIYFKFDRPIKLEDWWKFCEENGLEYWPNVIGRNAFYRGDVQVCFGEANYEDLPEIDGQKDFSKASPHLTAYKIDVSTYWMGNLLGVSKVALAIKKQFGGEMEYSSEFEGLFLDV